MRSRVEKGDVLGFTTSEGILFVDIDDPFAGVCYKNNMGQVITHREKDLVREIQAQKVCTNPELFMENILIKDMKSWSL